MSHSEIIIPPEFVKLVEARQRIRAAFAESRRHARALEHLAEQVPNSDTPKPLAPLTSDASPPQEVATALSKLEQELFHIRQIETDIQEQYTAIEQIKRKARNGLLILVSCAGILFVILLLFLYAAHVL